MGQTYNITMKHFNGVDYDTLLPASVKMEKVEYAGNGQYGVSIPTSVTFYTAPQLVLLPNRGFPNNEKFLWRDGVNQGFTPVDMIPLEYRAVGGNSSSEIYLKKSADGKTFYWYGNSAETQSNMTNRTFSCFGISGLVDVVGRGQTNWLFTENQTFIVPFTGRYYLELHGGGGGAAMYGDLGQPVPNNGFSCADGGASGQAYEEISLTKGQNISVIIGAAGSNRYGENSSHTGVSGGDTSFGEYSIKGGGGATANKYGTRYVVGISYGNLATTGSGYTGNGVDDPSKLEFLTNRSYGEGVVQSSGFGNGGTLTPKGYTNVQLDPKAGCVYLKYLGE